MKIERQQEYVQPAIGLTQAVVTSIIDCGTQADEKYGAKHKMMITLSLPSQVDGDGQAMTISKWFTVSLHEKGNLVPFIEGVTGKAVGEDFDTSTLLGMNCMAHLKEYTKENGDTKVIIASTSPLMEGTSPVTLETFEFSFDSATQQLWEQVSERMQNMLRDTPEYKTWEANGFMPF